MISTRDMGFVAYILMQEGSKYVGYDKSSREFTVDTVHTQSDLSVMYMNSESRRHDSIVIHLKQLIIGG